MRGVYAVDFAALSDEYFATSIVFSLYPMRRAKDDWNPNVRPQRAPIPPAANIDGRMTTGRPIRIRHYQDGVWIEATKGDCRQELIDKLGRRYWKEG